MAYVNLWELITTVAHNKHDLPNREKCEAIQQYAGAYRAFASELSLEIGEDGYWTVTVFKYEDPTQYISIKVAPNGTVILTRGRSMDDLYEERKITL